MAATQDDLDRLNANLKALGDAIATGEKQVTLNGKSVTYRSIAELQAARQTIIDDIAGAKADLGIGTATSRVSYVTQSSRGFNAC